MKKIFIFTLSILVFSSFLFLPNVEAGSEITRTPPGDVEEGFREALEDVLAEELAEELIEIAVNEPGGALAEELAKIPEEVPRKRHVEILREVIIKEESSPELEEEIKRILKKELDKDEIEEAEELAKELNENLPEIVSEMLTEIKADEPTEELTEILSGLTHGTLAETLEKLPEDALTEALKRMSAEDIGQMLPALPTEALGEVLSKVPEDKLAEILPEEVPAEDRIAILIAIIEEKNEGEELSRIKNILEIDDEDDLLEDLARELAREIESVILTEIAERVPIEGFSEVLSEEPKEVIKEIATDIIVETLTETVVKTLTETLEKTIPFVVMYFTEIYEMRVIGTSFFQCCDCYCVTWCFQYNCFGEWYEYKATNTGCEPRIQRRECRSECGTPVLCCSCGRCVVECGEWEYIEDCGTWQIAKREYRPFPDVTHYGFERPECLCKGECIDVLEMPEDIRFYNNPNYPTYVDGLEEPCRPEETKDPNNLFLPIKFDWDDVQGWALGWRKDRDDNICPADRCEPDRTEEQYRLNNQGYYELEECVQVYQVKIRTTAQTEKEEDGITKTIRHIMRDWEEIVRIANYKNDAEEASLAGRFEDKERYKERILEIRNRDLIITEYRVMIKYAREEVIIQYLKEDGEVVSEPIVVKRDELPELPHVRLGKSEIIVPLPFSPCFFKSGRTYEIRIRACCYELNKLRGDPFKNGHYPDHCGEWSEWQKFTTNWAPELYVNHKPHNEIESHAKDPDWWGKEVAKDQPLDIALRWCENVFYEYKCPIHNKKRPKLPKSFELFLYLGRNPGEENEALTRHPWTPTGDIPRLISDVRFPEPEPILQNKHYRYFTMPPIIHNEERYTFYTWRVSACREFHGRKCTDFSQEWRFSIKEIELEKPQLRLPLNDLDIPIGIPIELKWSHVLGAMSYQIEINGEKIIHSGTSYILNYPFLRINTTHTWKVRGCKGFDGTECGEWSEEWQFKTTGRPPTPIYPPNNADDVLIPVTLQWEAVPGAKSYRLRVKEEELFLVQTVKEPKDSLSYPDLLQNRTYSWQIRTCADQRGIICGKWSNPQTFTTIKLAAPTTPFPENNKEVYTYQMPKTFSWEPVLGARFYKVTITNPVGEEIKKEIVSRPSFLATFRYPTETYQWQVKPCLDEHCRITGDPAIWNFTLTAKEAPREWLPGLVPCGRMFDHPDTPWCETEPCGIKHIFILLNNIISFALWTMIPLILVMLIVYTGAMFYLAVSIGTKEVIPKVKALWRSVGIGFAIIFLSWILVTWILWLFGYQLGPWYYIPF